MTHRDADGEHLVVEWRVYYEDETYASSRGDRVEALPGSGVQGIAWHVFKDASVYCEIENGDASDPTIYRIGGRELIGTRIADDAFAALEKKMMREAVYRNRVLRREVDLWRKNGFI